MGAVDAGLQTDIQTMGETDMETDTKARDCDNGLVCCSLGT